MVLVLILPEYRQLTLCEDLVCILDTEKEVGGGW